MVSAAIFWYDATKPFLVNENGIKVNKENYCKQLKKQLSPAIKKLVKRDDWMTGYLSKIVFRHIDRVWYKISLKKFETPFC